MTENTRPADRRIQRTRAALRDALLSLMPEQGWDELTVQDICARANVGRSTFYAHFRGKEELLIGSLDDLRAALIRQGPHGGQGATAAGFHFVRGLIDHVHEQRRLCRSILGRRSGHAVQVRFRQMVIQLIADGRTSAAPGWQHEAAIHYLAGALVELLAWWVDAKDPCSADQVEQYFFQLARTAVGELK